MARRYISGARGKRLPPASAVLTTVGIGVGVLALTVIIAVLNGFQLGFIESILEISSYHVRVDNFPAASPAVVSKIARLPGVVAVSPFREIKGIARGARSAQSVVAARGLLPSALRDDAGLAAHLEFESGAFDLEAPDSILLGAALASRLGAHIGDPVNLFSITGTGAFLSGTEEDEGGGDNSAFTVSGIFRTGNYEYDLGWCFINISAAAALLDGGEGSADASPVTLGIKIKNRWQDLTVLRLVEETLASSLSEAERSAITTSSWRDYNKSFFGALRTEKTLMLFLVGLIFVVVSLNIFQSQRHTVLERREEIGLLRALGATDFAVRCVFACNGLIIGLTGAGSGMALALLISFNIPAFFALLESLVNGAISLANSALALLSGGSLSGGTDFAVFSPTVFYIQEIPARVIPHEAFFIFLAGLLSALLAAWFASGGIAKIKPAEVLRYE